MVLAMGFYQEFIDSVADVTALRLSPRRLAFLGLLGGAALLAIVGLAGVILYLLFHFPIAMYAAFIGLTLGGAPTLLRALRPLRTGVFVAVVAGIALMVGVLLLKQGAGFPHNAAMDVFAGLVGATTMVLPGVSGSYMLLVMDQYERVIGAVKDLDFAIILPVGVGAVLGVVGLAHLLKLLLRRWPRPTLGVLLGILLGSVIGLWPFGKPPKLDALERRSVPELHAFAARWAIPLTDVPNEALAVTLVERWKARGVSGYEAATIGRAIVLAIAGFAVTYWLGRTGRRARDADGIPATP
jgi:putative membrane protein